MAFANGFSVLAIFCNPFAELAVGEIHELHERFRERGVDLQTEAKIAQWQQQISSQIQQLQRQQRVTSSNVTATRQTDESIEQLYRHMRQLWVHAQPMV